MLELAFSPDRATNDPLYRQLSDHLRALIETDRLPDGGKLPATRELARSLGLSRNTVTLAYDHLVDDGLLTAHVGQGTFVTPRPARGSGASRVRAGAPARSFVWAGLFAPRARALTVPPALVPLDSAVPIRFDFRGGQVDLPSLPARALARAFAGAFGSRLHELGVHRDPFGWPPLRRAVAAYLVERGLACGPEDVAIVNGAQQSIDLVARTLLEPGDTVVMEQPGYFGASVAFGACRSNLVGVGVDDEGLRVDELARVLRVRRVKLVYVTPAAQCPTGVVMSDRRRQALLALADEHQTPVFEDDYDSELRYEGAPVAALKTLDVAGQVIYTGTFSKILFPGLRIGYVVAAPPLLQKMVLARWNADVETSTPVQAALATLLASGELERHLRRVRKVYAARLGAMLDALARSMPEGTRWTRPRGGHSVWVTMPPHLDTTRMVRSARDRGIGLTPGEAFFFDGGGRGTVALSFATMHPQAIAQGIALLAAIVRDHLAPGGLRGPRTHSR